MYINNNWKEDSYTVKRTTILILNKLLIMRARNSSFRK